VELRQLRYFQAVAEERSFSRAAARLHISQPPLSVHVKMLEEELGVQLLERTNRGVSLTQAGEAFYEEVREILRRLDEAKSKAQQADRGDIGTLSVGFVSIAGYGILPPAIKRFRERYPKVDVQLHELTTDAQIRELRAGRLDLGIGLGPVNEADLASSRSAANAWCSPFRSVIGSCPAQVRCGSRRSPTSTSSFRRATSRRVCTIKSSVSARRAASCRR